MSAGEVSSAAKRCESRSYISGERCCAFPGHRWGHAFASEHDVDEATLLRWYAANRKPGDDGNVAASVAGAV